MYQKVKAYMKEHGMVVDGDVVTCWSFRRRRLHGYAGNVKKISG